MTENRTGPQTIEFLTKRIVALGAVQTGQFLVDCETYMSVPQLGEWILIDYFHRDIRLEDFPILYYDLLRISIEKLRY